MVLRAGKGAQERSYPMEEIFRSLFQQGHGSQEGPQEGAPRKQKPVKMQRKPKGSLPVRILISLAITLVCGFVYFYFRLPALNIHDGQFYLFVFLLLLVFTISMVVLGGFRAQQPFGYVSYVRKQLAVPFYLALALLAVVIIGALSGLVIFRTGAYSQLLPLEEREFAADVAEISFDQIPMLDSSSSNNLANRKLGELSDLVSQFTVSEESAQINYLDKPVRVNYLNYDNFFKWLSNRSEGLPAYIYVDMVTQEVNVVRLEEGMKYSPSEYFGRDLMRHLRFQYPTKMFSDVNFEIDEEGTPYWIASVVTKTIGLFGGEDVVGAVLLNAITGESTYLDVEDVPKWVDRVYSASLIIEQYDYYGRYQNGFINSLFGQENCTKATAGYNYIAQDDDVWVYTGITSVSSDRGNVGFILVNQRTKEARYYTCAGAEEYSAMSSAEGAVQQFGYISTFPLLLNISSQPTYFMSLKDEAGLVKMYAMVNVQQYQIVSTGNTVAECLENYQQQLLAAGLVQDGEVTPPEETSYETITGEIDDIRAASVDGNTDFFFRLSGGAVYYRLSARDWPLAVILNAGERVTIRYTPGEGEILAASGIERAAE